MAADSGPARQVAVHVIHDLPHLVVESLFGIEDGLWGVLARGGFSTANRARRARRARLASSAPPGSVDAAEYRRRIAELVEHVDDATVALASTGTRRLSQAWSQLPAGGMLRLAWPLPRAALDGTGQSRPAGTRTER